MSGTYDVLTISLRRRPGLRAELLRDLDRPQCALRRGRLDDDLARAVASSNIRRSPPTASCTSTVAAPGGRPMPCRGRPDQVAWTASDENGDGTPAVDATGVYSTEVCGYDSAFAPLTGSVLWSEHDSCDGGGGHTATLAAGYVFARDPTASDTHPLRGHRGHRRLVQLTDGSRRRQRTWRTRSSAGSSHAVSELRAWVRPHGLSPVTPTSSRRRSWSATSLHGVLRRQCLRRQRCRRHAGVDGERRQPRSAAPARPTRRWHRQRRDTLLVPRRTRSSPTPERTSDPRISDRHHRPVGRRRPRSSAAPSAPTWASGAPCRAAYTYQWSRCTEAPHQPAPGATWSSPTRRPPADAGSDARGHRHRDQPERDLEPPRPRSRPARSARRPSNASVAGNQRQRGRSGRRSRPRQAPGRRPLPTVSLSMAALQPLGPARRRPARPRATYVVSSADVGSQLEVQVTATNSFGASVRDLIADRGRSR